MNNTLRRGMGINSREDNIGNKIRITIEGKTIIKLGEVITVIMGRGLNVNLTGDKARWKEIRLKMQKYNVSVTIEEE